MARATYEIRIRGRVAESTVARLGALHATVRPAETVLSGAIEDQAALHRVLERMESLGLELVEIRRLEDGA